ncbi:MAG: hypothetical protein J2P23_01405, partial [Microlunatus sp.]|nr:hypothetical protein [Microlunatus sp.]
VQDVPPGAHREDDGAPPEPSARSVAPRPESPTTPPGSAGANRTPGNRAGAADPPPWMVDGQSSQAPEAPPGWASSASRPDEWEDRDAAADRDDQVLDEAGVSHTELLQERLGAEIIAEEESGA